MTTNTVTVKYMIYNDLRSERRCLENTLLRAVLHHYTFARTPYDFYRRFLMPLLSGGRAPYAPPSAVLGFLQAWRDKTLPSPITLEVLERLQITPALAPRTLQSLGDLDLLDNDGKPTAALEGLKRLPQAEYVKGLAGLLRAVYAEVFQYVDPGKDDINRVADQFRVFEPTGQRPRMVTLFLGLCEAAEIVAPGSRKPITTAKPLAPRKPSKRNQKITEDEVEHRGASVRHNLRSDGGGLVPEPILGLLRAVPLKGWTKAKRDQFMNLFGSTLDFCVPILTDAELRAAEKADEDIEDLL